MSNKVKAVFLDRDGTINVDKGYVYRIEDFEYLPGVIEALKSLEEAGFLLVIITNQSGIARGFYTEDDYKKIDSWLKADLKSKGIDIAASYYCPHHPEALVERYRCACKCRKPGTELFWKAQKDLCIDMDNSYAIGDKIRDLSICQESGVKGILLDKSGNELSTELYEPCRDWSEVLDIVMKKYT